jgi:hypothetical protein
VCPDPRYTADGLACVSRPARHNKGRCSSDARQGWVQLLSYVRSDTVDVCRVPRVCRVSTVDLHIDLVGPIFTVCLVYRVSWHDTVTIWSIQATPRSTGECHVSPLPCACTRQRTFAPLCRVPAHGKGAGFFIFCLFFPQIPAIQTIYVYMVAIHK